MELIEETERDARGPYCGAIGRIDGNGDAAFNVAIRTIRLTPEENGRYAAELGVGGAIVADSTAMSEWRECLIKADFVRQAAAGFDLIETMGFDPELGVTLLELHLERMKASAADLGFRFRSPCRAQPDPGAVFRTRCAGTAAAAAGAQRRDHAGNLAAAAAAARTDGLCAGAAAGSFRRLAAAAQVDRPRLLRSGAGAGEGERGKRSAADPRRWPGDRRQLHQYLRRKGRQARSRRRCGWGCFRASCAAR